MAKSMLFGLPTATRKKIREQIKSQEETRQATGRARV